MQNLNRKNSFDDYGAEPSPLVWEKIEKRIPEPRSRKRRWLIWSAAAALLAGIFISSYLLDIEITWKGKKNQDHSLTADKNEANPGTEKTAASGIKQPQAEEKRSALNTAGNNSDGKDVASEFPSKQVASSSNTTENEQKRENNVLISERGIVKTDLKSKKIDEKENEAADKITEPVIAAVEGGNPEVADGRTYIENVSFINLLAIPVLTEDVALISSVIFPESPSVKNRFAVSRWHLSVTGGENYSYRTVKFSSSADNALSEGEKNYLSENERGIQTPAFETGIGYSLSTHFNLSFGINYFTVGQERTQSKIVFSSGIVGTPNTQYSVSTSAGDVTANGQQIDNAFFSNSSNNSSGNDTSLFTAALAITGNPQPEDSSTLQVFSLRQEFSFIGFPLLVQYQPAEHRFTPYVGLGLTMGYILKERVSFNDYILDSYYRKIANDIIFFAEAQAGVKYRISNRMYLKLQPSLRYGLSSVNGDENIEWIPYSAGVAGGINFRF